MGNELSALSVLFTEFYYWVCIVLMFLIHVGFCLYEVGISRQKNMMHTLMKNAMLIPLITVTFYFFDWVYVEENGSSKDSERDRAGRNGPSNRGSRGDGGPGNCGPRIERGAEKR
jgi:hypothetical protein